MINVVLVGSGKLANAIHQKLSEFGLPVKLWPDTGEIGSDTLMLHAGSGRELEALTNYCTEHKIPCLELATGLEKKWPTGSFPLIFCPNTSLLILKAMAMIKSWGPQFSGYEIEIQESHQASKITPPGTAHEIARFFGKPNEIVSSERRPEMQLSQWQIPQAYLEKHAAHKIIIRDGLAEISIETKILGHEPYVQGIIDILNRLEFRKLKNQTYQITDFIVEGKL